MRPPRDRSQQVYDARYGTRRWRRLRLDVLRRDRWQCWALGCTKPARVVDHIERVYLGMPDATFYGLDNLRASCWTHNQVNGRLKAEREGGSATPRPRSPYAAPRRPRGTLALDARSRFLSIRDGQQARLSALPLPKPIRGDYSSRLAHGRRGATDTAAS